jgi:hypothetical protein
VAECVRHAGEGARAHRIKVRRDARARARVRASQHAGTYMENERTEKRTSAAAAACAVQHRVGRRRRLFCWRLRFCRSHMNETRCTSCFFFIVKKGVLGACWARKVEHI